MFYRKLDQQKIDKIKREEAERVRAELESHYLSAQRDMRLQYEKDGKELIGQLRTEYRGELSKVKCKYQATIGKLKISLSDKEKRIRDAQKAIVLVLDHAPRMAYLAQVMKAFKESKILPLLGEYKEIEGIADEADSFERSLNRGVNEIKKLAGIDDEKKEKKL